ncbi:MAG: hypothetical protein HY822_07925 [Acidobacteria bacterium]|nr:hypothetical protein [Acidobacteriota bacterium]
MPISNVGRQRAWLLASAVIIVAWGSAGLHEGLNSGFSGGLYDPEYRVPGVRRGGLADKSGFKPGDRVIGVEGRPVEKLGMESRWPRSLAPRAGESRRFVVERNGERIPVDVVFSAPFAAAVNNRIRAALVGLAFLGFGLWAFLTVQTRPARTLAVRKQARLSEPTKLPSIQTAPGQGARGSKAIQNWSRPWIW